MSEAVRVWDKQIKGRLFAVGDLHGCYNLLMSKLKEIGFDFEKDLLASVGDLVDRGTQNMECVSLLAEPWFVAVRGNHEQLCIDGLTNQASKNCHVSNGGAWFYDIDGQLQYDIANKFKALPIVLEINHQGGKFGFVHGHIEQNNWEDFKATFHSETGRPRNATDLAIWGRERLNPDALDYAHVDGVEAVIMGHTVVSRPCKRDNCFYIDTGAVHNANLTIIELG